ncbi:hypothetical protein AB1286_15080 [Trinickia sp. NRRL B-1857]|uniref:hypothetical protein n=1 Tax=Trinickia sp. NRRL B-1857 TaxID=3162879 RepID=UPI003D28A923
MLVGVGRFREDRRYAGGVNIRFGVAEMGFDGHIGLRLQTRAQVRLEVRLFPGRLRLVRMPLEIGLRFDGAAARWRSAEVRLDLGLGG